MLPHEIYVRSTILEALPKNGTARRKILEFIRSLRDRLDTPGDYTDGDSAGRERQVKVIGEYAVTYWVDAAVSIVMVAEVRHADQ